MKNQKQKLLAGIFAIVFAVITLLTTSVTQLYAATTTPATINYQGRLLDNSNSPLSGNYTFRFSLWQSADWIAGDTTGAGAINTGSANYAGWQETHAVTTGTFGLFNMSLGSSTSFPSFDGNTHKYLQVEVKVTGAADTTYEILDPQGTTGDTVDRKTIHDQAYADNADTVDNADVGTSAGDLAVLGAGGVWDASLIPGGTDADSFIIDDDDSSAGDISLQFGNTLAKVLKYSQANSWFEFNDDVSFGKNEIKNVALDNQAAAPGSPVAGQIYHNTTDNNTYIWNGSAWEDITAGAGASNDMDDVYDNDADKILDVDNASGLELESTVASNITFDLQNTGDVVFQDAGTPFAWFTDTGAFQLDNLQLDGNTISSLNANGDIILDPNGSGDINLDAEVNVSGNILTLDSDNAGAGADVDIVANQGTDNDGTLRYNATNNQWEISNDGGGFSKIIAGTVSWADISTRVKEAAFEAEFDSAVIEEDGSNNRGKLIYDFIDGGGTNKRNFYEWTTRQGTLQDIDLVISFQLPQDFVSFTASPLDVTYQTSDGVTTTNRIDVSLFDTTGTAVTLTGGSNLANGSWTTANITFGGSPTFTAGNTITLRLKLSSTSAGWARISDVVLNYNGR